MVHPLSCIHHGLMKGELTLSELNRIKCPMSTRHQSVEVRPNGITTPRMATLVTVVR